MNAGSRQPVRRDARVTGFGSNRQTSTHPSMLHLVHLPDQHSRGADGDYAGLHLALRAASTLAGEHLIVAINSAARLDRLCPARLGKSIEFGCIAPPLGRIASAIRPVKQIVREWKPGSMAVWHPALAQVGAGVKDDPVLVIQGWNAPTASGREATRVNLDESDTLTSSTPIPTSAMARLLAREHLGIAADDERPLVTLLPNVPEVADAWWFSVIMSMLEAAKVAFIGAIPELSTQRGRGRRFRHASGLTMPTIEFDQPMKVMLDASDVIISVGRDSDRDVEVEETVPHLALATALDRVVTCQALASAVPTIVTPAQAAVVPAGLRGMLVADGTRASKIAARVHGLLERRDTLEQVRRVLSGSVIPSPDAEIVSWVRDRLTLRDLQAHGRALAGVT